MTEPTEPTILAGLPVNLVLAAYVECALFSTPAYGVDEDTFLDSYVADNDTTLSPRLLATLRENVVSFLSDVERDRCDLTSVDAEQVGHDLWLTHNGHGAGFQDRHPLTYGNERTRDYLARKARALNSLDLYVDVDTNTVKGEFYADEDDEDETDRSEARTLAGMEGRLADFDGLEDLEDND